MPEKITPYRRAGNHAADRLCPRAESAGRGAIRDETAEQIIGSLDYDFSLAEKDTAMRSGVIARTIVLDRLVGAVAQEASRHGRRQSGLRPRYPLLPDEGGISTGNNLDLPETIAVRQQLLPESGAISQLAMSAMDDWGAAIRETDAPALVIIEGPDDVPVRSGRPAHL